jgi:hypothetical protein
VGVLGCADYSRVSHLMMRDRKQWDEAIIRRYFYPWDVDEILKIKLSEVEMEDVIAWQFEKSGCFSVRSAYRLGMRAEHGLGSTSSSSVPSGDRSIWKKFWKLQVPPKVHTIGWRLIFYNYINKSASINSLDM